ncbi:nuclear body protein SP140-like protein isoform X2 [Puntigrus tetrazona]|uniref:nuclear body protein SP140-like protein isoform X2 n=1 Tax=Puntigrus tetrazona TaxID=1606681 RepID=UPI001C8B0970|nr:nuclear body protein SP140-like protein isoform X2 [Puntigrus tetrazona]
MDFLEFKTNEELLLFLHRKKTEISCVEEPRRLLTQLRDHDLVPENLYESVKKMRSRKQKEKGFYDVLDWVEKNRPQDMHRFWRCVFEDHILQLYPTLRILRNSLQDDTLSFSASSVKKRDEHKLSVTCGNKRGTLYRDKMARGEECILSQGRWFTRCGFEKFGERERWKNWKISIRHRNEPLKKLIKEGRLHCPLRKRKKKTCIKKNRNGRFPVSSSESSGADTSSGSREESDEDDDFQEQGGRRGVTELRERVEEEDMSDLSVFQAPSLPVTCASLTGTLYKYRFASGYRGKCIRTEERWFTPEEFVKQEPTLTDGHWKKDILCHGKTLNFLLQKKILCIRSDQEQDMMAQNNDDECYVCHSVGDLVCCDECPRAFHSDCHLPAVPEDSSGEWICTFCKLRNSLQRLDPALNMSKLEALNSPVSQYILHCRYLLLCVYRQDVAFLNHRMSLDGIKQKLESGEYQTVGAFFSDFKPIFRNCRTFDRDSEFGQMGARLKTFCREELRRIFKIAKEITPEILKEGRKDKHKKVYRFVCPYAGQFRCSLTSLMFVMEGEGEVRYNTVSWDPHLLGLGEMQPAGPLYNINCLNGLISGLHLPHCEKFSEHDMDCLSIAHFTGGNVPIIINPVKVTEALVVTDIKDLSIFGLIKKTSSPPSPVIAKVLVFLRPVTVRRKDHMLDVHLLPWNVPLSEVMNQHMKNKYIETSSKCCLVPGTQYQLCCQPKISTVHRATFKVKFGPDYHPTFKVLVNVGHKEVKLSLMDNTDECEVWLPQQILLTAPDQDV